MPFSDKLYNHTVVYSVGVEDHKRLLRFGRYLFKNRTVTFEKHQGGSNFTHILANKPLATKGGAFSDKRIARDGPAYKMSAAVEFTVGDFNEALFFTLKDYCTFLKFTMVEIATYYFILESVASEQLSMHRSYHLVVPLPRESKALKTKKGLVSAMLLEDSLNKIIEGKYGPFDRDREAFRKEVRFTTFDITHFAM